MSIYHCSIKIISRIGGRSAVASAAYRAGEKLYNDETGLTHDFTNKDGVIINEIMLPKNAPARFMNRETLWNEVQQIKKRSDAQFAREVEVALPVEMGRGEQIECVRSYIKDNFVDKGMIADWALHDKADGNPHVHIMLTMRGIDEHEQWLQKQKSVFANARDELGRAIYDPNLPSYDSKNREATSQFRIPSLDENGKQKTRVRKGKGTEYLWEKISIPANDWNEHFQAEKWRASWAEHCNRYLNKEQQIDHRSYERQGVDKEATIHEGATARQIEKEGKTAELCQINREIKERNSLRTQMKAIATELTQLITEKARDIYGRFKKFRGSLGNAECTGKDAEYPRNSAGRDRRFDGRESEVEGKSERIYELKRTADKSSAKIESTDREIAVTNQRIAELRLLADRKEANRDERLEILKRRRSSHNVRRDAGSDRESGKSELRSTADDINNFLRELNSKERASEEKRDDSIFERENRKTERERSRIKKERAVREIERRAAVEREEHKERSRSIDFSR